MLKILAFSDLHGEARALAKLKAHLQHNKYDAVLIAGDIVDHSGMGFFDELMSAIGKTPCFAVPGNIDNEDVGAKLRDLNISVDLRSLMFDSKFEVYGIGGALKGPYGTPNEYTDDEMEAKLRHVELKKPSIIVSHSPPYGFFDDVGKDVHIGSRSVLKLMQHNKPLVLVCGHVHETSGAIRAGKTTVVKLPALKDALRVVEIKIAYHSESNCTVETKEIRL